MVTGVGATATVGVTFDTVTLVELDALLYVDELEESGV